MASPNPPTNYPRPRPPQPIRPGRNQRFLAQAQGRRATATQGFRRHQSSTRVAPPPALRPTIATSSAPPSSSSARHRPPPTSPSPRKSGGQKHAPNVHRVSPGARFCQRRRPRDQVALRRGTPLKLGRSTAESPITWFFGRWPPPSSAVP